MSARRHFGKIMADLLLRFRPSGRGAGADCRGGGRMGGRSSSPVAVKVWALDVLDRCRGKVVWVAETDDLAGDLPRPATPGIALSRRTLSEGRAAGYPVLEKENSTSKGSARLNKPRIPLLQ